MTPDDAISIGRLAEKLDRLCASDERREARDRTQAHAMSTLSNHVADLNARVVDVERAVTMRPPARSVTSEVADRIGESLRPLAEETAAQTGMLHKLTGRLHTYARLFIAVAAVVSAVASIIAAVAAMAPHH